MTANPVLLQVALLTCGLSAAFAASAVTPFEGEYAVFENDKRIGTAKLSLQMTGKNRFTFLTDTEGDRGLAGFLGAEIHERSDLERVDGRLRSRHYWYEQNVAFRTRKRVIGFDYDKQVASEDDGKNPSRYAIGKHVFDRHAVVLGLAEELAQAKPGQPIVSLSPSVAHKGEVSAWQFQVLAKETVVTGEGSVETLKVQRMRANKERVTSSWHAKRWGYLPVRIEQVEPDGERFRMELLRWKQVPSAAATKVSD